jgi:hypothetical protein
MLDKSSTQQEIAVRLYDNKFYGTTYGKGLYRKAIYNGSIDMKNPSRKYVIDLFQYNDWSIQASTDEQVKITETVSKVPDTIYSWIFLYDPTTKIKTPVYGCCVLDLNSNKMEILINSNGNENSVFWELEARPCKPTNDGRKVPQLLATNTDLTTW